MENMRYLILMWGAALIFVIMGVYVMRRKKPMRLWATERVSADKITDIKAYNRSIGKMYCVFSIPLWIAGVLELWFPIVAIVFFSLTCTVGIGGVVWYYHKIEEKYMIG